MKTRLRNYLSCQSGNVAMMFACLVTPILIGVGVAADMHFSNSAKMTLQDATDSAVLAAARFKGTDAERENHARQIFTENMLLANQLEMPELNLQTLSDGRVIGNAQANLDYVIMGMFGVDNPVLDSYAEAAMTGVKPSEIVFVLDYSSSMNDQYEPMRDAVIELINTITTNGTNTDVKIGLVPFAREVYMSVDGKYIVGGTDGVTWSNCTISRDWPHVWKDNTPTNADSSKWGLLDEDYSEVTDSDYYEDCHEYPDNNLVIRPLSADHAGTLAQLQAMTPYEGTNITVGMTFGFQVVSPNAPFTEGVSYSDPDWNKYIILLSDGSHNKPGFGPGNIFDEDQGRANLQLTCDKAQQHGVSVITVAYELDDPDGKAALQSCASDTRHYLEGSEQDIADVFERIGGFFGDQPYLIR
ncbi:MAG: hypothetical protein HKO02_10265 [Hyphomonadaceae bacterium]|nr:hypothetical protein [Hyphomonadaceae bacterium]